MNNTNRSMANQTGIGLVSAIFVISVLALIAAGMASMVAHSAKNHSQQMLSVRAQSAALSALEIKQVKMGNTLSCSSEKENVVFSTQGLFECHAIVRCTRVEIEDKHFIHLTSEGACGSGADMAVRFEQKRILK